MNLPQFLSFPLVAREMRSQSRTKGMYVLRTLFVAAMLALVVLSEPMFGFRGRGSDWFSFFSLIIFYGVLLLAPVITAGCISSERENGTLGLLFLSTLRSFDIVAGKFATNFLRLAVIAAAGVPVLACTLLMGGVTNKQVTGASLCILAALISSVGISVLASALCTRTRNAMSLAVLVVVLINVVIPVLNWVLPYACGVEVPRWALYLGSARAMHSQMSWGTMDYLYMAQVTFATACLIAALCVAIASWWLPRTLAVTGEETRGSFKWRRGLRRWFPLSNWLDMRMRNSSPLFWLEWRQWGAWSPVLAVLVAGGGCAWCAWVIKESFGNIRDIPMISMGMGAPAHIVVAALSVGNICRDVMKARRERTLELLLCAPVTTSRLMWSRFAGAWMRYGSLYLAISLPVLVAVVYGFFRADEINMMFVGSGFEIAFPFLEFVEDFSFFSMLIAISQAGALRSTTLTGAILSSFGIVAAVIIGWVFLTFGVLNAGRREGWDMVVMELVKIGVEILIFARVMYNMRRSMPERIAQSGGPA